MSGSVNKVTLVGNLCADPEIRRLNSGDPVANLRIATSESWRDRQTGERKQKTEFHSVVIFNEGLAKVAEQYLKKGAKVYIEGQLQTRKWQDQNGNDKYTTEIILQKFRGELQMLDSRGGGDGDQRRNDGSQSQQSQQRQQASNQSQGSYSQQSGGFSNDLDDTDIPF